MNFYFLHTEEFLLLFAVFIFLRNFDLTLVLAFSSILLHWIVDDMYHYKMHKNFDFLKNYSLLYNLAAKK